eukprot:GHVT01095572.1.p1 GENE.GHVT01095572.1~~GHVT01095572.1.p1  ORF type:complete len:162 (+),score=26.23 GHVT01095572.1:305-790(+)
MLLAASREKQTSPLKRAAAEYRRKRKRKRSPASEQAASPPDGQAEIQRKRNSGVPRYGWPAKKCGFPHSTAVKARSLKPSWNLPKASDHTTTPPPAARPQQQRDDTSNNNNTELKRGGGVDQLRAQEKYQKRNRKTEGPSLKGQGGVRRLVFAAYQKLHPR